MDNYEILLHELKAKVELQNELLAKLINQSVKTNISDNNRWGNAEVACSLLKCKRRTLYRLVAENRIISSNISSRRHKLYDLESIKAYIENQAKLILKKQPKI